MKQLFLIIGLSLLLTSVLFGQANWVITSTGVGDIKLGASISEIQLQLKNEYQLKDNDRGGFDVFEGNEKLISVWPKRIDGTIGFVKILSNRFSTTDGLRTGLTIVEVEKIRKDFILELDEMTGQEYFRPDELQTFDDQFFENLNLLYFKSDDETNLGVKYEFDESTQSIRSKSHRTDGYLEYFYIFQWK